MEKRRTFKEMMYFGDEVKAMARGWLHPEEYYEWALEQVKRRKLSVYKTKTIKLDDARTDIEFSDVQGDALAVISIDGTVNIRLNEKENDLISLNNCREIPTGFFYRIFVSNTAQTGKSITLYFGHAAGFRAVPIGATKIVNAAGSDINPATLEVLTPLAKASQHGVAEVADTDILASDLSPTNIPCLFRTMVMLETSGVFSAILKNGGVNKKLLLNSGNALTASAGYLFDIFVHTGDTVNFQTSVAGNVTLRVQEIVGGVQ